MTHVLQNCPKLKSLHVMVVQVCTVNGQTGLSAVLIALVDSLAVCNIMTVDLNQLSKKEPVVLIAGLPGLSGPLVHRHVLGNG